MITTSLSNAFRQAAALPAPEVTSRHSERSPRSEDLRPIARLLCDESLFSLVFAWVFLHVAAFSSLHWVPQVPGLHLGSSVSPVTASAAPFAFKGAGFDSIVSLAIAMMGSPILRFPSSFIAKKLRQLILNPAPAARQNLAQRVSGGNGLQKSHKRRRRVTSFSFARQIPRVIEESLS